MVARAEDGRILRAGYSSPEEGLFGLELRRRIYPHDTYLEALNPRFPRISESRIPNTLDLAFLTDDIVGIYLAAEGDRTNLNEEDIFLQPTAAFSGRSVSLTDATELPRNREAGMNVFYNPFDREYAPTEIVRGGREFLPALADNLYEMADRGYYIPLSLHNHPRDLPEFPTLDDWMPALQQRQMGENVPLLNGVMVLGDIQVMAQMTKDSPLLTDRQCIQFRARWVGEFVKAQRQVETIWWNKHGIPPGLLPDDAQIDFEQQKQAAEDSVRIALAEAVGAKMFVLDQGAFQHEQPSEIISLIRKQQTVFSQAA